MAEITDFNRPEPMALASFCRKCGQMVGMSMLFRRPGVNNAFRKHEEANGRRVEEVTVARTRREIVADCLCRAPSPTLTDATTEPNERTD